MTSNVPMAPAGSVQTAASGKSSRVMMAPPPPRGVADKRSGGDGNRGDNYEDGNGDGRRTESKRRRKHEKEKHAVVLDEIAPKETGRQAIAVRVLI